MKSLRWIPMPPLFAGLGVVVAIWIVLLAQPHFVSDESWHLNQVGLTHKWGFGSAFIQHWHASTGPLIGVAHRLFEPLTHLALPGVRLVGIFFTLLIMFTLSRCAALDGGSKFTGLWFLGIPFAWKLIGVVYSEIPAIFFITISLWLMKLAFLSESSARWIPCAVCAGLATGLGVAGRQPYLGVILVAGLCGLLCVWKKKRREAARWFLYTGVALILPVRMFALWGGLQAPINDNTQTDWQLGGTYALYSLGYLAICVFLMQPRIARELSWRIALLSLVATAPLIWLSAHPSTVPMKSLVEKLPVGMQTPLALTMHAALLWLGTLFALSSLDALHRNLANPWRVFLILSTLGLGLCHVLIGPIFSSRYFTLAIPFLLLWMKPGFDRPAQYAAYTAGILLGAVSLWSHIGVPQGPAFWDNRMEVFYPHLWQDRKREVFSPEQWEKFHYGTSHYIQNPRWGPPEKGPTR